MLRNALRLTALLTIGLLPMAEKCSAQEEYQFKAVYLYNFCRYVEWPKNIIAGDDKVFILGVLGPDPFGDHLKAVAAQMVDDRKIIVKHFASVKDYQPCHLLFVADKELLAPAVVRLKGAPVLLVGDSPGLAQKGAMINLYLDAASKVRFEINNQAAKKVGLKISGRLLQLGTLVKSE